VPPASAPLVLDRYAVLGPVGSGAFGQVFRVLDTQSKATRALKVVPSGPHEGRLLDEFAQLAKLAHPSLPAVYDVGRTRGAIDALPAGSPFFVAEWIDGAPSTALPSLADTTTRGARLWSWLADVAGALATIHAAGLVHADVAPGNVLVTAERAVLVDLGLAGSDASARGTPAFMAPEAFVGRIEPRSDLYSLGATAIAALIGHPPFDAPSIGALVQLVVSRTQPLPPLPDVPAPLVDLITRLLARDVDDRPASALAVLDELDQLAPAVAPSSPRRARPAIGASPAAASWPSAASTIAAIAEALASSTPIAVVGPSAGGGRLLVDAAVAKWQLARVANEQSALVRTTTIDTLADLLRVATAATDRGSRAWIERLARAAVTSTAEVDALVVDVVEDPRASELVHALARAPSPRRPLVVLTETPPTHAAMRVVLASTLDVRGLAELARQMLGARPDAAWLDGLLAASGGFPLTAIELIRSAATERDPLDVDWAKRASEGSTALRARQLDGISAATLDVVTALAVWGGRARTEDVLATSSASGLTSIVELERSGLASRTGDELAIDRSTLAAVESRMDAARLAEMATAGLEVATRVGATVGATALAALLGRASIDEPAAVLGIGVATSLLDRGRADLATKLAVRIARESTRASLSSTASSAHLIAARAYAAQGAYTDATTEAKAAERAGADPIEARLVLARTAQRAGDLAIAERELERLHADHPAHAEIAGTYARLLVTRSRYANARSVATNGALANTPLSGLRAEAAGLAAFYLGELDAAESAFAALESGARAAHDTLSTGRALSLRGMVAQQRGHLAIASERYAEAAKRLGDVGEIHAAATAELNLGTVLAERGRASEGLPRLAAAERVFTELGATTELCAAELNRGNALVAVNQFAEAQLAAKAAVDRTTGVPHLRAFALIVYGDALERSGEHEAGATAYREALAIALERKDSHAQISAHIALAEAGLRDGDGVDVAALCASEDDTDRWTVARSKLVMRSEPHASVPELLALAKACSDVAHRSSMADRLERAFRAHAVASGLAQRAGDTTVAMREARDAKSVHASLVSVAAPAFRAALDDDPDLNWLRGLTAEDSMNGRNAAVVELRPGNHAVLRRLLTLSRRLNSEASVERILDDVIDTAIELTDAERGFLLLRQPDGELVAVVARNFGAGELSPDAASEGLRAVSRSIAERAAQTGEPVMTVDAGVDERFGTAASVATMRLRSVLAVPLRQRGTITGCIYVDHRLRGGAFDEGAASVLGELADIAAIAIENARLTQDLRSTTKAVDDLNGRLSAELADRDAELVRVRAELPARERLRGAYEAIVGRSPAMLRMLEVIDRAAATSLPVVIVGESGTGKELVARALHDHGPRAQGPFVAINCSAVPEPLLESELFGHVRGAFTGAERDRRGLFEVADGGTLFLDEIADTTPAMQAKLLRVLQDGMIRRVGDTATRKVDVRVLAASQQPLAALVTQGRFREDLRFRLEVIQVPVPPLREREGDISVLVERLLARLAPKGPPPRLTRAALRALQQHRWPGNVRELENALARGVAMGGDVIDVGDLPEVIANAAARPEPTKPVVSEDLQLKPALAATEHAYITAAMARAKNNQTVAARLLGLSRFGLQKKLRRLAGDDASDEE
jgi:transcriptional regulator with GAF, ATPase, and Fis domain/Tfp pilus assembly protein PilF